MRNVIRAAIGGRLDAASVRVCVCVMVCFEQALSLESLLFYCGHSESHLRVDSSKD